LVHPILLDATKSSVVCDKMKLIWVLKELKESFRIADKSPEHVAMGVMYNEALASLNLLQTNQLPEWTQSPSNDQTSTDQSSETTQGIVESQIWQQ